MKNRKLPDTSLSAYKSVSIEMQNNHFSKILKALKVLGVASAEQIATYIGMEHSQINRRISEMERLELIWKPGNKVPTKSGRMAYQWQLRGDMQVKTEKQENIYRNKGVVTAAQHAANILNATQPETIQQTLFK